MVQELPLRLQSFVVVLVIIRSSAQPRQLQLELEARLLYSSNGNAGPTLGRLHQRCRLHFYKTWLATKSPNPAGAPAVKPSFQDFRWPLWLELSWLVVLARGFSSFRDARSTGRMALLFTCSEEVVKVGAS